MRVYPRRHGRRAARRSSRSTTTSSSRPTCGRTACPPSTRTSGPRVERHPVADMSFVGGKFSYEMGTEGPLADWWLFEDKAIPHTRLAAAVGVPREEVTVTPITYEDMRPGCYDQKARLEDMDANWTEAQMCFPTMPRFSGQTFTEMNDRELGLPVRAGLQRLDGRRVVRRHRRSPHPAVHHAAVGRRARGRRGAAHGRPGRHRHLLHRDPRRSSACRRSTPASGTRSSRRATRPAWWSTCTSARRRRCRRRQPTRRRSVGSTMTFTNCMMSMVDFLMSGVLVRYPNLKLAYAEGQLGWIPYILERADKVWQRQPGLGRRRRRRARAAEHLLLPADLRLLLRRRVRPHCRPRSRRSASATSCSRPTTRTPTAPGPTPRRWPPSMMGHLDDDTVRRLVRGNAIELLQLDLEA